MCNIAYAYNNTKATKVHVLFLLRITLQLYFQYFGPYIILTYYIFKRKSLESWMRYASRTYGSGQTKNVVWFAP